MEEKYVEIGKINIEMLKDLYDIKTERLIITKERIIHINKRHNNDYNIYGHYILDIIKNPDYILKDIEIINTVLYLKTVEEINLQIEDIENKSNTIITFWHMRKKSYNQIIRKNKIIFQELDKEE